MYSLYFDEIIYIIIKIGNVYAFSFFETTFY